MQSMITNTAGGGGGSQYAARKRNRRRNKAALLLAFFGAIELAISDELCACEKRVWIRLPSAHHSTKTKYD